MPLPPDIFRLYYLYPEETFPGKDNPRPPGLHEILPGTGLFPGTEKKETRIGKRKADGTIGWPEHSISGRKYQRPCTHIGLGGGYFYVEDMFPAVDYKDEIEKLKAVVAGMNAPPTPKAVKRKSADES